MAIDTGLGVTCADLQATGGIKQILLRSWATTDAVVFGNGAGEHDIDSILTGGSLQVGLFLNLKTKLLQ
jgi:hypothetical protein